MRRREATRSNTSCPAPRSRFAAGNSLPTTATPIRRESEARAHVEPPTEVADGNPSHSGNADQRCLRVNRRSPVAARVAARTDQSGGPGACWPWTGRRDPDGYGRVSLDNTARGAHVLAWELANGRRVPPGQLVRHRCDNPPCVNPAHLSIGSYLDNSADAVARGRTLAGERNPSAKLTAADVVAIRAACESYRHGLYTELARKYCVTSKMIALAARGLRWRSLPASSDQPAVRS